MKVYFLLFIIVVIVGYIVYKIGKMDKMDKSIYNINEFTNITDFNQDIDTNFDLIVNEVKILLKNKTDTNTKIYYGDVYSPNKNNILQSLKDGNGWSIWNNERKDWFHYPISYNGNMLEHTQQHIPVLYNIINKYKNAFHSLYISALKPHGSIDPHNDGNNVDKCLNKKILTYHIYFDAENSIIGVDGKEYEQKTRNTFIFDNTKTHWVKNNSDKWRVGLVGKFYTY